MNTTTDELHDDATMQKEILGEVSDTVATTDFDEEKEILPSTDVKDILPMKVEATEGSATSTESA